MGTNRLVLLAAAAALLPAGVAAQAASTGPSGRAGHVLAYDPVRGETLLLGGDTDLSAQSADSLWGWTGTEWRVHGPADPGWRTLPAMAFDTRRGRLVLYGGKPVLGRHVYADTAASDTWEWDGVRWMRRDVSGPGPLDHHAMAYDEARGAVVVQGGADGGSILPGETWIFDGEAWTRAADAASGPGQRVHHAMAYDARRRRVILFGGFGEDGDPPADVWEWDGSRWQTVTSPGPGPRSRHRMAYDAERGVTVLYGGTDEASTWTWDGRAWRRVATEGPPPRDMHAMAWDARRRRIVLYGGGGTRSDLWEWDGERWLEVRPGRPGG